MSIKFYIRSIALALVYFLAFFFVYYFFLNKHFEYIGFEVFHKPSYIHLISGGVALLPIVFYRGTTTISSIISIFIYIILYVPIIATFSIGSNLSHIDILPIQILFMSSMCLLFVADRILLKMPFKLKPFFSFRVLLVITIVSIIYMAYTYRGSLKLVAFEDVYEQRLGHGNESSNIVTRYLSSWLMSFMSPVCMAYGFISKKIFYILTGAAGFLILYMATADKISIIFPFIFFGFYKFFKKGKNSDIFPVIVISLSVVMTIMTLLEFNLISAILLSRTIGNAGLTTLTYLDFFSTHPHTYYTHINIINTVTHSYPYGNQSVGQIIGSYFWSDEMNANAHFWATDGIASLGLKGVTVITVVVFLFFKVLNSVTNGHNLLFVMMCFIPFINSIANMSFFSSLWTGGAIFLIALFLTLDKEAFNENKSKAT